jgi:hypothetical protein
MIWKAKAWAACDLGCFTFPVWTPGSSSVCREVYFASVSPNTDVPWDIKQCYMKRSSVIEWVWEKEHSAVLFWIHTSHIIYWSTASRHFLHHLHTERMMILYFYGSQEKTGVGLHLHTLHFSLYCILKIRKLRSFWKSCFSNEKWELAFTNFTYLNIRLFIWSKCILTKILIVCSGNKIYLYTCASKRQNDISFLTWQKLLHH